MIFVFGSEGRFETGTEVWVSPATTGHTAFTNRPVKIDAYVRLTRQRGGIVCGAVFKRGVAVEGKGRYARVLPPDAEEGLAGLDRNIEAAEEALRVLRRDRQDYLAAHVVRGERIALKHIDKPSPKQAESRYPTKQDIEKYLEETEDEERSGR